MAIRNEDVLMTIKEQGSEETPLDSTVLAAQLGAPQNRIASSLTTISKKDKHLHRRAAPGGKGFVYWYDATKASEFYKMYKNGLLPKRGSGAASESKNPPMAPFSMGSKPVTGVVISGIVFLTIDGKQMFTSVSNLKEA